MEMSGCRGSPAAGRSAGLSLSPGLGTIFSLTATGSLDFSFLVEIKFKPTSQLDLCWHQRGVIKGFWGGGVLKGGLSKGGYQID